MRSKVSTFNVNRLVRAGVSEGNILQADTLSLEILGGYYYLSKGSSRDKRTIQELNCENPEK